MYIFNPEINLIRRRAVMVKSAGDAVTGRDVSNEEARLLLQYL